MVQWLARLPRERETRGSIPVGGGSHFPESLSLFQYYVLVLMTAVLHDKSVARGCWWIPSIGSERKNSVRKAEERYKPREEKWGKRCGEAPWICPLPLITQSPCILMFQYEFLAIEYVNPVLCLDATSQVGQMSPGMDTTTTSAPINLISLKGTPLHFYSKINL